MFRTAGYYRGVNCPFFASGLCERPYCHFRHVKSDQHEDVSKAQTCTSKETSSYLEKLSDGQFPLTSESIKSFSKDKETDVSDERDNETLTNIYTSEPIVGEVNIYTGERIIEEKNERYQINPGVSNQNEVNSHTGKPVEFNKYTGEPIYRTDEAATSISKHWKESNLGAGTPTYNPTPLSELQKRNTNPAVSKYSLSVTSSSSSQEYDPESNYSTKVNHVPVPQVGRPVYSSKRSCSYDPARYKKPALKRQRVASFFDSKFSSDEDEEEETQEKNKDDKASLSDKEDSKYELKDVNYFERLLDGPNGAKKQKELVKEESDDSLDSLDEDVDVTPLLEKCRRRSQSGGTETSEEKLDSNSKNYESAIQENDSEKYSNGNTSVKVSSKKDVSAKRLKCDRLNGKEDLHQSTESSLQNCIKNNCSTKRSTTPSEIYDESVKKKHRSAAEKTSSKSSRDSPHKSSSSSSSRKTSHHKSNNIKSSQINKNRPSHRSSSSKTSLDKAQKVISKQKSKEGGRTVNSDKVLYNSENSKDSSVLYNHSTTDSLDRHKHSLDKGQKSSHNSSHSSSDNKSVDKGQKSSHNSSHSSGYNKSVDKGQKSSHNSSHSLGSKGKEKQNLQKENGRCKEKKNGSKENKEHKNINVSEKKTTSESSGRRISTEEAKKKIININVDLFGADSEDEDNNDKDDENTSDNDMITFLHDSDYSDDDIDRYDECLKIFQENKGSTKNEHASKKKSSPEKGDDMAPPASTGKKRVAYKKDAEFARKVKEKPKSKMSPAEVMHNRFLQMQKKAQEEAEAAEKGSISSSSKHPLLSGGKKRTAHSLSTSGTNRKSSVSEKTVITTASRTEKRKAHTPNIPNLKRPTIPSEFGSKVPSNIRQRYLNLIIDECLKICNTEQEAFDKGQEEEAAVYKRSSGKSVYLNVAVNTIKRLRTEQAGPSDPKKSKEGVFQLSHEQILGGKNATKTTFTINRSGGGSKLQQENFKGAELYKRLTPYILTEEQLKENGFPRTCPTNPGSAIFHVERKKKIQSSKPTNYEKLCVRCGKVFIVYPNGTYANKEECCYHWGKAWKKRIAGMIDTRYTCCQGDLASDGCQVAKGHVHETNKWEILTGYMKTFPCSPPVDGDYGVFAMDCEMVYTKMGVELARVTVTDPENDCVYESLVKPDAAVIDYNTRFSGLTEEDLRDVTTTLRDVQAVLLSLFSDRTIVMGHSLESDFSAVKLLHNTVVDTSVVFPHKMGPPYKRALKTLMAEYLKKIIQDDVGGHDSKEDATSCMELMHLKIKEDARKEPRRS